MEVIYIMARRALDWAKDVFLQCNLAGVVVVKPPAMLGDSQGLTFESKLMEGTLSGSFQTSGKTGGVTNYFDSNRLIPLATCSIAWI